MAGPIAPATPATHVALWRAVNLGPHNKVAMRDLAGVVSGLGLRDVATLLQSGNVVFSSEGRTTAILETMLEQAVSKRLRLETDVFVRTAREWKAIVSGNPFPDAAAHDPGHLLVVCLKGAPAPPAVAALRAAITGPEVVRTRGREAYIVYPDGVGRSRLTSALIDRTLGTSGTGRNWNTVLKIGALLGATP